MIKNKKYIQYLSFKPYLLLLIIVSLFFNTVVYSKEKAHKKRKHWKMEINQSFIYDNNILKYSEKYLERFRNRMDQGRFHINTYDDFTLYTSLRLSYNYRLIGILKTIISGFAERRAYTINGIKSWNQIGFGFQQYFTKKASIKLFYSNIPEFYVRHFRDEDWVDVYGYTPETFQAFSFSKNLYGVWIQNTFFNSTRLRLLFSVAQYYHNKHYTEYDSDNITYGFMLNQKIYRKFAVEIAYQFIKSKAKAFDASTETIDNSTHADASYEEDKFFLGFNWKLPRIFKLTNNLNVRATYSKRYYSSKRYLEIDRLHAGRIDDNIRIYAKYRVMVTKNLKASVFYNWFQRESNTSALLNKKYLANEKNYQQYQVGLELVYKLKL
jgi:hypothetical protein